MHKLKYMHSSVLTARRKTCLHLYLSREALEDQRMHKWMLERLSVNIIIEERDGIMGGDEDR